MKALKITAYYPPSSLPCCMRGNPNCDMAKVAECEERISKPREHSWLIEPGTFKVNEYTMYGHIHGENASMGESFTFIDRFSVEEVEL